MQPLRSGALKPLPPTASGPKLVENVLGKPGKLSFLGSQGRERESLEAPFSPDTHILTDLGCEPSDEESGVETSQRGTFLVLSPCAGDRGLQRPLTVREKRGEERRGAEEEKERKGRRTGGGGWCWEKEKVTKGILNAFFCFRCPCFPKLSLPALILLLAQTVPFWGTVASEVSVPTVEILR